MIQTLGMPLGGAPICAQNGNEHNLQLRVTAEINDIEIMHAISGE